MAPSYADYLVPILKKEKLEHRRNIFDDVQAPEGAKPH